ncbi:hypothetical protein [Dysgonomonas macrotermitis]|uniref:Uncharacterized protein n=1 Tax=Dysgonomonas macrotermitis TaxID=1346286 RepID=A0A1M5C2M9_9BACT|nr:hypothetical protein [Dysgonomonas macrotermitis]SHF49044.1 hypothetical protein SAMN05444362_1079 [Dysgonomonas macrotermitis]
MNNVELGVFDAMQYIQGEQISNFESRISFDPKMKEVWINIYFGFGQLSSIILNTKDRIKFINYLKEFIKIVQEAKKQHIEYDNHIIGYLSCDIASIGRVNINDVASHKFVVNCDYTSQDTYCHLLIVTSHLMSAYISVMLIERASISKLIAILDDNKLN